MQVAEQFVDLLRHQHGGGLVEDEDLGAAVQHLQDLHPLTLSHTEVRDRCVEIQMGAGLGHEPLQLGACRVVLDDAFGRRLITQDDVLQHGEVVGEHEVLMHHADARRDCIAGGVKRVRGAEHRDGARLGLVHAVQRLHQRGLPSAVLAHDGVDRAGPDVEVHVMVGDHAGEPLLDPAQLDGQSTGAHAPPQFDPAPL